MQCFFGRFGRYDNKFLGEDYKKKQIQNMLDFLKTTFSLIMRRITVLVSYERIMILGHNILYEKTDVIKHNLRHKIHFSPLFILIF